jgi:hypothetical protein
MAALLAADTTFMTLAIGGLWNDPPDEPEYPYTVIEFFTVKPRHRFGGATAGLGWRVLVRLHTYSTMQGQTEALAIRERAADVLNFAELSIAGFASASCELEMGRALTEPNKEKLETRHLIDEYAIEVDQ